MTTSNIELAHELWAMAQGPQPVNAAVSAIAAQLDAFAERIRADERAALASAPAQPVAVPAVTVEHDSTPLPSGMPEPVAAQIREGFGDWVEHPLASALAGGFLAGFQVRFLYTAAQVQAMLSQGLAPGWQAVPVEPTRAMLDASIGVARNLSDWRNGLAAYRAMLATAPPPQAAQPSPAAVERKPLTEDQIEDLRGDANRGHNIGREDYFKAFRDAESAHGIKAQQGVANDT